MTTLSPRFLKAFNSRFTCRALIPSSSAASRRVITFLWALRNVTSRSLSAWVISSCPSCIPKAWGCQGDISTLLKGDIITLPRHMYWEAGGFSNGVLRAAPAGAEPVAAEFDGPTIFAALQDQLGLRLQSKKASIEALVIDHLEKVPTE